MLAPLVLSSYSVCTLSLWFSVGRGVVSLIVLMAVAFSTNMFVMELLIAQMTNQMKNPACVIQLNSPKYVNHFIITTN